MKRVAAGLKPQQTARDVQQLIATRTEQSHDSCPGNRTRFAPLARNERQIGRVRVASLTAHLLHHVRIDRKVRIKGCMKRGMSYKFRYRYKY
jgi:hypothetical protein